MKTLQEKPHANLAQYDMTESRSGCTIELKEQEKNALSGSYCRAISSAFFECGSHQHCTEISMQILSAAAWLQDNDMPFIQYPRVWVNMEVNALSVSLL